MRAEMSALDARAAASPEWRRMTTTDEPLMRAAIEAARQGIAAGQLPVGGVLVRGGEIVATGHNTVWRDTDPTAHAEMNVLRQAVRHLSTIDLTGSTLYCTLEPCPMCLGASHWARVDRIVYGAGIADSAPFGFSELQVPAAELVRLGRSPLRLEGGLLAAECRQLFTLWKAAGLSRAY
jgi:tRNA(Arg) A34 adenosine deaminase TadA